MLHATPLPRIAPSTRRRVRTGMTGMTTGTGTGRNGRVLAGMFASF